MVLYKMFIFCEKSKMATLVSVEAFGKLIKMFFLWNYKHDLTQTEIGIKKNTTKDNNVNFIELKIVNDYFYMMVLDQKYIFVF